MALFGPAWQASVSEQVPAEALPSAVALNSLSYNIARSFGPAIGGVIVAAAGAIAAFATNALFYLPLIIVLYLWRRVQEPSRLPPERLARAVISGVRYILNSPSIRILLTRTLVTGIVGGSVSALMPIATRDLLRGDAQGRLVKPGVSRILYCTCIGKEVGHRSSWREACAEWERCRG
jgi:MFS family permease